VLRFADGLDVDTLNPWYATTENVTRLSELTMAKFSRFDRNGHLVPELVTEIPSLRNGGIGATGNTVIWHLRHDVRWSDGAPFDAQDVLFTIAAAKNANNAFATMGAIDNIAAARAVGPYTVVMTLKRPDSEIEQLFSTYGLECIIPRHLLARRASIKAAPYNALPVGIGPFRYLRFSRGSSVVMEANPFYFRGRPRLRRIVYAIVPDANTLAVQMQTGELDLWPGVGSFADRLSRLPGITVARRAGPEIQWIEFNVPRPLVADRRVRAALRLALDRPALLRKILHGYGAVTDAVVPPFRADAADLAVAPFDPSQARRLLDVAGWRPGPDGVRAQGNRRLTLRLIAQSGSPAAASLVELVRDAWQRIGVAVDVRMYAIAQYFAPAENGGPISAGNFDVALAGGDPYGPTSLHVFFGCASAPPHGLNDSRYCNRSVDAGIARAAAHFDVAQRRAELRVVQAAIAHDVPIILAYRRDDVAAYGRRVVDYTPTALTLLDDMMNVDAR
jgi:peptide/nickel transport system substrate-binding protein